MKHTIKVIDDNSAATAGTDINVVPDLDRPPMAHLESTTANDADMDVDTEEGSDALPIIDSDSPGGVALYFDEDAPRDARFNATISTGYDVYVPLRSGRLLRVKHKASPTGVITHVDDDAATASDRILFVSPSDADSNGITRGTWVSALA